MPKDLTYELALTRAEAGESAQAEALFRGRFFASEEGGITSNEVLFEIELMQAEHDVANHNCRATDALLNGELAALSKNGASSQGYFRMAAVAGTCGHAALRTTLLEKASLGHRFADRIWAYRAAQALSSPDIAQKKADIEKSLPAPGSLDDPTASYTSYHWYGIGLLQAELHQRDAAIRSFRTALSLPDEWMAHHLARVALQTLAKQP
jgi:hypothetical protein